MKTDWRKELEGFNEEELKQIMAFILAIRIVPVIDDLRKLTQILKSII